MRHAREILKRTAMRQTVRRIAGELSVSTKTVTEVRTRARTHSLSWADAILMTEEEVEAVLFPPVIREKTEDVFSVNIRTNVRDAWKTYTAQGNGMSYQTFARKLKEYADTFKGHLSKGIPGLLTYFLWIPDCLKTPAGNLNVAVAYFPWSGYVTAYAVDGGFTAWEDAFRMFLSEFDGVPSCVTVNRTKAVIWAGKIRPNIVSLLASCGTVPDVTDEADMLASTYMAQFSSLPEAPDAEAAAKMLNDSLSEYNTSGEYPPERLFGLFELKHLMKLPSVTPEAGITCKVGPDFHVKYGHCLYSVPYVFEDRRVEIFSRDGNIEILADGVIIAVHGEVPDDGSRNIYVTDPEHMPPEGVPVNWYPERIVTYANRTGGEKLGEYVRAILDRHVIVQQGYRECLNVIRLAGRFKDVVPAACEEIFSKKHPYPSYREFKNTIRHHQ